MVIHRIELWSKVLAVIIQVVDSCVCLCIEFSLGQPEPRIINRMDLGLL